MGKYAKPKLLRCPFCGSEATYWPYEGSYLKERVSCSDFQNCSARIGNPTGAPCRDVIKKWNTRPNIDKEKSK